jgi:hypothetical protein
LARASDWQRGTSAHEGAAQGQTEPGQGGPPRRVVHLTAGGGDGTLGFESLLLLAQELAQQEGPAEICVVTSGLARVERRDPLDPRKATLLGPLRVIPWEHPGITCRAIDIDPGDPPEELAGHLAAELLGASPAPLAALRGGERWVASLEPVRLATGGGLRQGGAYLMAGDPESLATVGRALADHLTGELGARVETLELTGEPPSLEPYGRLDGVFLLAGTAGMDLVRSAQPARLAERLTALAAQTEALARAAVDLADRPPGFLVLFSSLAAVTGGVGRLEAAAAGAFLGAWARGRRGAAGPAVLAVDWPDWQGGAEGLSIAESVEALQRALASGLSHVAVSPWGLQPLAARRPEGPAELRRDALGVLGVPYAAPGDEVERTLAGLWEELLGVPRVGVHDDFFQLGGHSQIGLQILARLREAFAVELPLGTLFEAPTVAGLAAVVRERRGEAAAEPAPEVRAGRDAAELLENIGELSEGELDALLAEMGEEDAGR